jgi:hypothetical protein
VAVSVVTVVESDSERAPQRGARERMENGPFPRGSKISEASFCHGELVEPSGALHPGIFEQPGENRFLNNMARYHIAGTIYG